MPYGKMDIAMQKFNYDQEFLFFLQRPAKRDHYLIIQTYESTMHDWLQQFNGQGIYKTGPATMPHNKVSLIEKVAVPDKRLFGLRYFICHATEEITYEEDKRCPYAEWSWHVIKGQLQINKWLQQYIISNEAKKLKQKAKQKIENKQISLF